MGRSARRSSIAIIAVAVLCTGSTAIGPHEQPEPLTRPVVRPETRELRSAAQRGDRIAQFYMGEAHFARGTAPLLNSAATWYQLSAGQDYAPAQHELALFHEKGWGVPQSDSLAVYWYTRAANQGFARSQLNLGVMCQAGRGIAKSDSMGALWYRRAANSGLAMAQFNLGYCFWHGLGVPAREDSAAHWFKLAADSGFAPAKQNLAIFYLKGIGGPIDTLEARRLLKSAEADSPD